MHAQTQKQLPAVKASGYDEASKPLGGQTSMQKAIDIWNAALQHVPAACAL
jgi:hypothetical protein